MRKILFIAALACALAVSCKDEWDPVFTFKYQDPAMFEPSKLEPNCTIADLKKLYVKEGHPVKIDPDLIIKGQVVSEDRSGNIYKSLYIQDETGAIELKIGKNGLSMTTSPDSGWSSDALDSCLAITAECCSWAICVTARPMEKMQSTPMPTARIPISTRLHIWRSTI